tara:strand:+ start:1705 stop:2376 length:672 start_codon:yes stop_codon:yes gene_type:complete
VSVFAGFAILITEAVFGFYKKIHSISFGIYGAAEVGKTTLHKQLRTRGEVPEITERTEGIQRATRKIIKIDGDVRTIKAADVGGQSQFWKEWREDIRKRKVQYIIFVIDDSHLKGKCYLQNQLAWQFMIDIITDTHWKDGKKPKKKKMNEYPKAVAIWANKYDLWEHKYEHKGDIQEHPIFSPFKMGINKLNEMGIPTHKYIVSAKSNPEMVYRGVMTMIKDY